MTFVFFIILVILVTDECFKLLVKIIESVNFLTCALYTEYESV